MKKRIIKRIIDYKVVTRKLPDAFFVDISDKEKHLESDSILYTNWDKIIKEFIEKGWQPVDRSYIILDETWAQINQTMVLYEYFEEDEENSEE